MTTATTPSVESKLQAFQGKAGRILAGLLFVAMSIGAGGGLGSQASGNNVGAVLPVSPVSVSVLVAGAVHAGLIPAPGAVSGPNAATQFQCPLAPCTLNNVRASEIGTQPVGSSRIAVNPKSSRQLLSGALDQNCPTNTGFNSSSDGGATWSHVCLAIPTGSHGEGDPIVGYDLKNNSYIGGRIDNGQGASDVVLDKSTNNGATWSAPVIAVTPYFTNGLIGRPWLQIDTTKGSPHANTLYISATQDDLRSPSHTLITVSHSSDGGTTWSAPIAVDTPQTHPSLDEFSDMTIGKDGTVYVTWMRCAATDPFLGCSGLPATMEVAKSTDGGNTWSAPVTIASVTLAPSPTSGGGGGTYGGLPNTHEPTSNIPAIGIDNSTGPNAGHLYVVMYNWTGAYMQVQVASSSTGGATWAVPVPVAPNFDTNDQFFPWLSVSNTGVVGVTWLDRRNDPANVKYEAFATFSTDGGSTFATNVRIANAVSNPLNDGSGGYQMGDRTGNTWIGNALYASWMDTRNTSVTQDEVGGLIP